MFSNYPELQKAIIVNTLFHYGPDEKYAKVMEVSTDHETVSRVNQSRFRRIVCQTVLEMETTRTKSKVISHEDHKK